MLNLESYEHESYEYAKTITYNWIDYLKFSWINLLILIKIFMKLFYDSLVNLTKIFEEKKLKNISNQVALVTGGANGLGREIACRLAQEKCHIMICDVNYNEAIKTAEFIAEIYQVQTKAYKVDVSKFEEIQKLKNDIEQSFGPIDILINNAGIMPLFSLREGRPQDIQKIINVNFVSHFWTVRTFLDGMIERKRGHIVGISSLAGRTTFPCAIAYASTKHAINGFMQSLYDELCAFDHDEFVKVTTVYPSFINTRQELANILDESKEFTPRMSPEYVADEIVQSMLNGKREITLPHGSQLLCLANFLPMKSLKIAKLLFFSKTQLTNILVKQRKPT